MFNQKTLFVVGAGASKELNLPTGPELKEVIANKLNIQFDYNDVKAGDPVIARALFEQVQQTGEKDINAYLAAAWKIRDALPQALSIDNFIDAHSQDGRVAICGKLAIAQSILEAESKSILKLPNANEVIRPNQGPNISLAQNTWLGKFFKLLCENVRREDISSVFDNVSFVVFNYDRCIEHYLFYALQNYYNINEAEARELIGKLVIVHPYERVGPLPWQDAAKGTSYGGLDRRIKLLEIADQIRTFAESETTPALLQTIYSRVTVATTVVFLGFAFHELNMELLKPDEECETKRVFATALGMSKSDAAVITEDVKRMLGEPISLDQIEIGTDLTCSKLFDEYWRSLSR